MKMFMCFFIIISASISHLHALDKKHVDQNKLAGAIEKRLKIVIPNVHVTEASYEPVWYGLGVLVDLKYKVEVKGDKNSPYTVIHHYSDRHDASAPDNAPAQIEPYSNTEWTNKDGYKIDSPAESLGFAKDVGIYERFKSSQLSREEKILIVAQLCQCEDTELQEEVQNINNFLKKVKAYKQLNQRDKNLIINDIDSKYLAKFANLSEDDILTTMLIKISLRLDTIEHKEITIQDFPSELLGHNQQYKISNLMSALNFSDINNESRNFISEEDNAEEVKSDNAKQDSEK